MGMSEKLKSKRAITLVALIVTVIVLMILAGITLTLVLGQNGIIEKAKQAKEVSTNSDKETVEGLNNLYNEIIAATDNKQLPTTVADATGKELSTTENIEIKDDEGNTVTIPAGFKIASDSKTRQEDGIVIEDKDGNQFVWIPIANISDYKRISFMGEDINTGCTETMPLDEQTSISRYHGYYIGRYEAGDNVSTQNKIFRSSGASVTNKVAIKKGQTPYNWISKDQMKILAEGMKTAESYKSTTKLCSSYAWDTAVNFIQKTISNYGISSPQGNYKNTTFTYINISGENSTKLNGSDLLVPTGQTTSVCNIYDMGGNLWELTSEQPNVARGGYWWENSYGNQSSGSRYINIGFGDGTGFRITLFI